MWYTRESHQQFTEDRSEGSHCSQQQCRVRVCLEVWKHMFFLHTHVKMSIFEKTFPLYHLWCFIFFLLSSYLLINIKILTVASEISASDRHKLVCKESGVDFHHVQYVCSRDPQCCHLVKFPSQLKYLYRCTETWTAVSFSVFHAPVEIVILTWKILPIYLFISGKVTWFSLLHVC